MEKAKPVDPKPFIFLDVSILREYLAVELNLPHVPFPFDLEFAIDDWIFMIFFVGNDFLPHLPSLEIREGAIDALLRIWRAELPRMGGYLTNHGKVDLDRAQIILEGLAKSEDEIFQKRKDGESNHWLEPFKLIKADEERQDISQKRRRIEEHKRQDDAADAAANGAPPATSSSGGTMQLNGTEYVAVTPAATARGGTLHPSLPTRPAFDIISKEESVPNGKPSKKMTATQRETESLKAGPEAILAMQGSNVDWVKNRKAIRMTNLSAAQMLKAELEGGGAPPEGAGEAEAAGATEEPVTVEKAEDGEEQQMAPEDAKVVLDEQAEDEGLSAEMITPAIRTNDDEIEDPTPSNGEETVEQEGRVGDIAEDTVVHPEKRKRGSKRKAQDDEDDVEKSEDEAPPNPEADQPVPKKKLKFNPDGTVDGYVDDVRWVRHSQEQDDD